MLRSRDIAASVKVAISVALIPRTIIAHSSYDIIVILQDHDNSYALSVACRSSSKNPPESKQYAMTYWRYVVLFAL
jgi:hypothetical protein